ncbi:hypothetical protein DYB25_005546 [Aphanomyces astaci]|uniref:GAF domain-containing protein n=1 Tax=Aphanomyces astaci TaxID=112090 RepID=A0A397B4H5_APHAT|nr:hypothetical protein DYB25_005546 [Aphanomyces astaci]RHY15107.1 hypothetical protein DYB36_005297 [Aphanomyces astaci]RHZ05830.1 hypothetical protein DYB26_005196 [Aphanomyces astaci]
MASYSEWESVRDTIASEASKTVVVLFDAPWAAAKTKIALSNLELLLGAHRTDLVARNLVRYIGWHAGDNNAVDNGTVVPAVDYAKLTSVVDAITKGETDFIANCANVSAAIWDAFHEAKRPVNWAGFYLNRPVENSDTRLLVLGPFHGKPACKRIQLHSGVCGAAASTRLIQRIPNVHDFPGHIACDSASASELVVPVLVQGDLIGVLDLDCPELNGFHQADADGLQAIVDLFANRTHWDSLTLPVRNLPLEPHPEH